MTATTFGALRTVLDPRRHRLALALLAMLLGGPVFAGGGYFILGYGPMAAQSGGTATAIGFDGFSGSNNPAKQAFVDDRLDLDVLLFSPYRRITRSGAQNADFDFSTTSKNDLFELPELGYAQRIDDRAAWGVAIYGNGGLNTEYHGDTGVAGSSANPAACGDRPANFFLGCGKLGFDLMQVIIAPTLSYKVLPTLSIGVSPLFAYQQFKAYGLQAFQLVSTSPEHVTNQGYDSSLGAGVRVGVLARLAPWLDAGVGYSTKIFMQDFDEYRGLIADHGSFDVPANFSVGVGLKPLRSVSVGLDIRRIYFNDIPALSNGTLNSLQDPQNKPFGSRDGTGFHWGNVTDYRLGIAWSATEHLTLRAGGTYGKRPARGTDANSVSLNLFAPNPKYQLTFGGTYAYSRNADLHLAYGNYVAGGFRGESATGGLGVGGTETIHPHVHTLLIGYSRHFGT